MGAVRGGREINLGQPFLVFSYDGGVCGLAGEIGPFVGIFDHVVEFLAAVGIVEVAPALTADAMIALVVAGDSGAFAFGRGILELGAEAETFEIGAHGHPGEIDQRG
jgi:hypothetical protein